MRCMHNRLLYFTRACSMYYTVVLTTYRSAYTYVCSLLYVFIRLLVLCHFYSARTLTLQVACIVPQVWGEVYV